MTSFNYATTRMHFAAIFVMQLCVTHERFFSKEKLKVDNLNTLGNDEQLQFWAVR